MNLKRNTKKGSITLEAALFLPVFILAILTIGYFVKVSAINENATHSAIDETNLLAARAYGIKIAPTFPKSLEKRLMEEGEERSQFQIKRFRYLYSDFTQDGLISFQMVGKVNLHMPLGFEKEFDLESRIKCRGFIGKKPKGPPMPFSEMEENRDSEIVLIFPMSGKRYHMKTCTYVQAKPTQMVFCKQISDQYTPCRLCKPETLSVGTFVYCFLRTGQAYHRGDCNTIDKYTIEIEKKDAIRKGYTPCSKCGGETDGD